MGSCSLTGRSSVALAILVFSGCSKSSAPLGVLNQVPAFTLTSETGEETTSAKVFGGKVWIANFIYTTCPGPCPRTTRQMALVQSRLKDEPDFRMASFTVDPENDGASAMAAYARRHDAIPGRWYFFTGSKETLNRLALEIFFLGRIDGKSVDHSTRFVLVDRKGRYRNHYDSVEATAVDAVVRDARTLLEEIQ
jgi:protein SCO1/2